MTQNRRLLNEQFEKERLKKFDEHLETIKQNEAEAQKALLEDRINFSKMIKATQKYKSIFFNQN